MITGIGIHILKGLLKFGNLQQHLLLSQLQNLCFKLLSVFHVFTLCPSCSPVLQKKKKHTIFWLLITAIKTFLFSTFYGQNTLGPTEHFLYAHLFLCQTVSFCLFIIDPSTYVIQIFKHSIF